MKAVRGVVQQPHLTADPVFTDESFLIVVLNEEIGSVCLDFSSSALIGPGHLLPGLAADPGLRRLGAAGRQDG